MCLSSYMVKLYSTKKNTSYHIKNYSLKSKVLEDHKEVLLTSTKNYIKKNINPISYEGIKEYFNNLGENFNIAYGSSYIEYMKDYKQYVDLEDAIYFQVIIKGPREDYNIKQIYKCMVENGNISFKYAFYDALK